ncbi:adaptin N terminal region-domain-containing protein [Vararia minispora EC-137]|uniref:Adaptin N terminal region-domain-containing protein n=1 Tax=Vararia minispora EC-137 TaxID=1314806 RepID=A0ACB8QHE3_9AGAM|nr:adaptin N terminal region-domain-containing protein [Vararia minispora EC-137]
MWERTLQDLIRGLRANKKEESKFIAQAVDEIRKEIRSKDMELKAGAVLKLTYLEMLGHDMTWASFHVVEVMSSPKYHLKTIGYLAATQSFGAETDVLMLTTNLLKKDLASSPADVAVSVNGLSHFIAPDLARDLSGDLVAMLNHSRPHVRKRAVIAVYRMLAKYPQASPYALTRLKDKLEDSDIGVVSATANAMCELVRHNPNDYLSLAPQLFHLLTTSSNNWMLIKLVKIFGFLSPHEPRLVRKLQPPITELISTTPAISLLYECVHTCIVGGMLESASGHALAETCVTKLAAFLGDLDQNLKYIALLAMVKIVPSHPHLVARYQDMILASVNDQDVSIRIRALDLLTAMASQDNIQSIVQQLLSHLVHPDAVVQTSATQSLNASLSGTTEVSLSPSKSTAYRLTLAQRILAICSQDTYSNVIDFHWYLSVLVDLAYVAGVSVGADIRDQLVDVVGRVRAVRRRAVELMVSLLSDESFIFKARDEGSCAEVLWAAAWVCGEHCGELAEPRKLIPFLIKQSVLDLAPETIAVYLQAVLKVFGVWTAELSQNWDDDSLPKVKEIVEEVIEALQTFVSSPDIEVQERAANALQLFTFIRADLLSYRPHPGSSSAFSEDPAYPKSLLLVRPLFTAYDLNPVNPLAQTAIPSPDDVDLDAWIVPPPAPEASQLVEKAIQENEHVPKRRKKGKGKAVNSTSSRAQGEDVTPVETSEERARREQARAERLERQRDDPFYIPVDKPARGPAAEDIDSIPVVHLDDMPAMSQVPSPTPRLPSLLRAPAEDTYASTGYTIDRDGEMPTDVKASPSTAVSRRPSSALTSVSKNGFAMPPAASFQEYVAEDEASKPRTPGPVKVTRVKRSGAKKRTVEAANGGAAAA